MSGGPWTRHGHPVEGVTVVGCFTKRPPVAQCGGPLICHRCAFDAARIRNEAGSPAEYEGRHRA